MKDYLLLYPDQKVVTNIPKIEMLFPLEKYNKEFAKPYFKLDLYLCRTSDFSTGNPGPLSNLNGTESTASAASVIANSALSFLICTKENMKRQV